MRLSNIAALIIGSVIILASCAPSSVETYSTEQINEIMGHVDGDDPAFTVKDVQFDSVLTLAGTRTYRYDNQRVKAKFFYYGDLARGYYNLTDRDSKNLQVFGKKVDDLWAFTCVTKVNMEEVGGYMILDGFNGIWSSGHINFEKQNINFKKLNQDYDTLQAW